MKEIKMPFPSLADEIAFKDILNRLSEEDQNDLIDSHNGDIPSRIGARLFFKAFDLEHHYINMSLGLDFDDKWGDTCDSF